jgi:hypothetical protein
MKNVSGRALTPYASATRPDPSRTIGYVRSYSRANRSASAAGSSTLTPTKATPRRPHRCQVVWIRRASERHGPHLDDHMFNTTGVPRSPASASESPATACSSDCPCRGGSPLSTTSSAKAGAGAFSRRPSFCARSPEPPASAPAGRSPPSPPPPGAVAPLGPAAGDSEVVGAGSPSPSPDMAASATTIRMTPTATAAPPMRYVFFLDMKGVLESVRRRVNCRSRAKIS